MITETKNYQGTVEESDVRVDVCWGPREVLVANGKQRSTVNDVLTVTVCHPATGLAAPLDATDKAIAEAAKVLLAAARAALAAKVTP